MKTTRSDRPAPPRDAWLWAGLLGPPVIWLLHFQVRYTLAGVQPGSRGHAWDIATGVVALLAIGALGLLAWRGFQVRQSIESASDSVGGRERFMALLGLMVSGLFWLLALAQLLANLFLRPGPT